MIVTRVRPKLGDVVEVPLPDGRLAYVQYVKHHKQPPRFGALLRLLPGVYIRRPQAFGNLVREAELYCFFFPLGAACHRRLVTIVANEPIPSGSSGGR